MVWTHYLVLLYVPIALMSPDLSYLWFLPMLSAFAPMGAAHSYGWAVAPTMGVELFMIGALSAPVLLPLLERRDRERRRALLAPDEAHALAARRLDVDVRTIEFERAGQRRPDAVAVG